MEQFANNAASTLSAAVETTDGTSISVTSATGFPTTGNFRIRIDDEIMLVTGVSGTTFTVSRAQEGTTGATHESGAAVTHVLTAGALEELRNVNVFQEDHSETCDGIRVSFTTAQAFILGTTLVWLNGLLQQPGIGNDYTEAETGDGIIFTTAPLDGDTLLMSYLVAGRRV